MLRYVHVLFYDRQFITCYFDNYFVHIIFRLR